MLEFGAKSYVGGKEEEEGRGFFFPSSSPQTPLLLLTRERTHTDLRLYGAEMLRKTMESTVFGGFRFHNWRAWPGQPAGLGRPEPAPDPGS